ncbi:hypothetical protein N0V90_010321 [Kalmusia sp. IMI 367209]|nr:hypothetical protein N0V90_010321 [Kalmusia sp. IMI 367209]
MNWFHMRTVPKIPGLFAQNFWNTLLQQVSVTEPAVFHATLTLSSAHKTSQAGEDSENSENSLQRSHDQEKFMLRNYSKAIHHLQPHLATKDLASTRVALIACVIFTCLEFLRGNFKTAQIHLKNGLLVLQESYGVAYEGVVLLRTAADATDQWILETFQRLHVQAELFHRTHRHPILILQPCAPLVPPTSFRTLKEAWTELERILYKILALTGKARYPRSSDSSNPLNPTCYDIPLIPLQQHIQTSLAHWLTTYKSSKLHLDPQEPTLFINAMLMNFHTLASILSSTALSTELAYDAHTARFLTILSNSIHLWKSRPPPKVSINTRLDMSHSTIDFGVDPTVVLYRHKV